MVMGSDEARTKNESAGEGHHHFIGSNVSQSDVLAASY
jgi:hypothetical protein